MEISGIDGRRQLSRFSARTRVPPPSKATASNSPARRSLGIRQLQNKCYAPVPLRTQGCCDLCARGYEPSPDTYVASTALVVHRLAA